MGNGVGKLTVCFTGASLETQDRRYVVSSLLPEAFDDGLGHSFCYLHPDPGLLVASASKVHSAESATAFRLSGASVSANTSTPLSTSDPFSCTPDRSADFKSSTSFAAVPLQPIPRSSGSISGSGPMERGFLSGPMERGFMSGPLDHHRPYSAPLHKPGGSSRLWRSFSHGSRFSRPRRKSNSVVRAIQDVISRTIPLSRSHENSVGIPFKQTVKDPDCTTSEKYLGCGGHVPVSSSGSSVGADVELFVSERSQNLQWAQGRAGEDRVHVVISDEHEWIFVGIYDGFNGPDAPDFLSSNLYTFVYEELKGLLWDEDSNSTNVKSHVLRTEDNDGIANCNRFASLEKESQKTQCPSTFFTGFDSSTKRKSNRFSKRKNNGREGITYRENQRILKYQSSRETVEFDAKIGQHGNRGYGVRDRGGEMDIHKRVLEALSRALKRTDDAYLNAADKVLGEVPELALMGSCVLVMLLKGDDVYTMNVGDSRAVLAQKMDSGWAKLGQDLEMINEEPQPDLETSAKDWSAWVPKLNALQLTVDHSTNVREEVRRIRREHPDDACAVYNDRVKGSLKVTRAFGAGFLKQPKWNSALLEMFRIDYIGSSPYITCFPSLRHHKLGPNDRFLILSSDGLYQYLTNQEAVYEVELFLTVHPEGDPAQHLVEEVLFRAAKKAGLDFHDLLDIPHGDRRRYHDDISIIVISLEGRIWRSCLLKK